MDDFLNNDENNKNDENKSLEQVDKDFPDSNKNYNRNLNNFNNYYNNGGNYNNFNGYNNGGNYGGYGGGNYGSYHIPDYNAYRKNKSLKNAIIILFVAIFALTIIFTFFIAAYSNKVADMQSKIAELQNSDSTINYFVPEIDYSESVSPYEAISTKGIQQTVMIETKFDYSYTVYSPGIFGGSTSNTYTSSGSSSGSGVLYYEDNGSTYIITNNHVVNLTSEDIGSNINNFKVLSRAIVVYITGKTNPVEAEYVGGTSEYDIAVLKIQMSNLNCLVNEELGTYDIRDSKTLKYGEEIVAVGNALGLGLSTTTGVISRPEIYIESNSNVRYVQIDAVINNGNSGGPSYDMYGKLVGINCASLEALGSGSNVVTVDGTNFAIPANTAVAIADNIIKNNGVEKVSVGVNIEVTDLDWDIQDGVYAVHSQQITISSVESGSAAANAGVKSGDIVFSMNQEEIINKGHWLDLLFEFSIGDTVELVVIREGEQVTLNITFNSLIAVE